MTFYRQTDASRVFLTAVTELLSCLCRMWYSAGFEGAEKKNLHPNRLLVFFLISFHCLFCIWLQWHKRIPIEMAVSVALCSIVFEIYGKNDIFKCFHRHFALAAFSINFLTSFCDAFGFVFILCPPLNTFIHRYI